MAFLGILGNAAPAQAGILGPSVIDRNNLNGWDWGSLAAGALQDAYAGYWGQQGNNVDNALGTIQGRATRNMLAGLTSDDPAIRQKAYQAAALYGIDTRPFQQQQAAAALPKLLQSMQPAPETASVTAPAVTANLPQLGGALNVPAMSANFDTGNMKPGLGLSDALAQSGSPELQAQFGPEIIKDTLERQAKAVRPATVQEKAAAGLSADTPAQVDAFGKISPITDPRAITPYQQAQLDLSGKKFGEEVRHNKASEANSAPGDVDPQTVDYWAQSVAAGAPLPALGMGKEAALYRQAILKRAAQINNGQGLTGVDQNVNTATTKGNTAALSKQTQLRSATEGFENTMLQNMNIVRGLLKKGAGTTGVPLLNRWQQYARGEYAGDPDVIALNNAIDTVADENAKIRSGTLGNTPATDSMRANIKAGLNGAMTPEQILSAFDVMEKDSGNRTRALRAQEDALRSGLKGRSDLPNIPGIHEPQAQAPGVPQALPADPSQLPRLPQSPTNTSGWTVKRR